MKNFTTCYIVEISGEGLAENINIEHLQRAADGYMTEILANLPILSSPETEALTVRFGKIPCNEKKNIKEHLCLKKIKLKKLDK